MHNKPHIWDLSSNVKFFFTRLSPLAFRIIVSWFLVLALLSVTHPHLLTPNELMVINNWVFHHYFSVAVNLAHLVLFLTDKLPEIPFESLSYQSRLAFVNFLIFSVPGPVSIYNFVIYTDELLYKWTELTCLMTKTQLNVLVFNWFYKVYFNYNKFYFMKLLNLYDLCNYEKYVCTWLLQTAAFKVLCKLDIVKPESVLVLNLNTKWWLKGFHIYLFKSNILFNITRVNNALYLFLYNPRTYKNLTKFKLNYWSLLNYNKLALLRLSLYCEVQQKELKYSSNIKNGLWKNPHKLEIDVMKLTHFNTPPNYINELNRDNNWNSI